MQTYKNRFWRATLTLSVLLLAPVACGRDAVDWQEVTSATGNYIVEFPGKPTTETIDLPNGLSLQLTGSDADSGYYALAETALHGTPETSLDTIVDSCIEGTRTKMESTSSNPVTATEISRTSGEFEGVETREFRVKLSSDGNDWALRGLVFYQNDVLVNPATIFDSDADPTLAEHFLSSLKSKQDTDLRALHRDNYRSEPASIS